MAENSLKDLSKRNWTTDRSTTAEIQTSALIRIADASEKMASNYTTLQNDRDYYKRRTEDLTEQRDRLQRKLNATRGVVTRQRKTIALVRRQRDALANSRNTEPLICGIE